MILAGELGKARKHGDEIDIAIAKQKHDEYRDICLRSDEMLTGFTVGALNARYADSDNIRSKQNNRY